MTPIDPERSAKAKALHLQGIDPEKVNAAYAHSLQTGNWLHPSEDKVTSSQSLSQSERTIRELQEASPTLWNDEPQMDCQSNSSIDSFETHSTASHFDFEPIPDTTFADLIATDQIATGQTADDQADADQVNASQIVASQVVVDLPQSMTELLISPSNGTADNMSYQPQYGGTESLSSFLSDSHWGSLKIPEECDIEGRMVKWTKATVQKVEPYIEGEIRDRQGGSGILDTTPATLHYLQFPMVRSPPPLDTDLHETQRYYFAQQLTYSSDDGDSETSEEDDWAEKFKKYETVENDDQKSSDEDSQTSSVGDDIESNPENALVPYALHLSNLEGYPGSSFHAPYIHGNELFGSREYDISQDTPSTASLDIEFVDTENDTLLFPTKKHHFSSPGTFARVVIFTVEGLTLRIDMPTEIVFSLPGKHVLKFPYTDCNDSHACWTLIKNYHINGVESFSSGLVKLPVFDTEWIQTTARHAMFLNPPTIEYYLDIQALCEDSPLCLSIEDIDTLFYMLGNDLPRHYLLNQPLAPPLGTLEEKMTNGSTILIEETNLTVSQFIKRLYLESKLNEHQLRSIHAQLHPNSPQPFIYTTLDAAAMVDDWEVAERVEVPKGFKHYRKYFDLQQIDWEGRVGIDSGQARDARDERYIPFYNMDFEESEVRLKVKLVFTDTDKAIGRQVA